MPKKILTDISSQKPAIISLKEEGQETRKKLVKNAVDCSVAGSRKIRDINVKGQDEEVFYFFINEKEDRRYNNNSEVIRLAAAGMIILLLLNFVNIYYKGLDLKTDLVASASSGYESLIQAGQKTKNSDFRSAETDFNSAQQRFSAALSTIAFLNTNQDYFLAKENTVDSAQNLLLAAKNISLAGENFAKGIQNLKKLPEEFISANLIAETSDSKADKTSITEKLKSDFTYMQTAIGQVQSANDQLKSVSADVLPPGFREKLSDIKNQTASILTLMQETSDKFPAVLELLGDRYPHRYLILLQNDTESRPTGGFIGSYIIADLNDGYLTKFEFHDVYELDGQLQEKIEPPPDIAKVSDNWRMRDSNYSPDFPVSAEKAAWFLQKQNGPSVDTIIALNQSFISDLLKITGPLQISSLKSEITAENFQILLSYIIESKISGETTPKKILEEIIPAFKKQLFSSLPLDKIVALFLRAIDEKKILIYSRKPDVQKVFDSMNISGRIKQNNSDYLNVTVTSIGGNKSDRYIDQNIQHYTYIEQDGTVIDEVAITRKHTWNAKDLSSWKQMMQPFGFTDFSDSVIDILGRGINKTFVKVYVPKGSKLTDASGISKESIETRDDNEINKTYFFFEMDTDPGNQTRVALSYMLPAKLNITPADSYKFFAQNQPLINPSRLEKNIYVRQGLKFYRQYPETIKLDNDGYLHYESDFASDVFMSALVGN